MRKTVVALLALALTSACGARGPEECLRNVECVERCGGPVVVDAGCGSCPTGLVDIARCAPSDAGRDSAVPDASTCAPLGGACGVTTCCGTATCCVLRFDGGGGATLCQASCS